LCCLFGAPAKLLSDQGRNFTSSVVREACRIFGVDKVFTTAYHPQTDGLVERFNSTLCDMLSMYVSSDQKDWDAALPLVTLAYNTSVHSSTNDTPFFLLFGKDATLPTDVTLDLPPKAMTPAGAEYRAQLLSNLAEARKAADENLRKARGRQADAYNSHRREATYGLGDLVWVFTPKPRKGLSPKLQHLWHGPFRIEEHHGLNYKIQSLANKTFKQLVHVQRLKPFYSPEPPTEIPQIEEDLSGAADDPAITEPMQPIVRTHRKKKQYLIRWLGYSPEHDSWEPAANVSKVLIDAFEAHQTRSSSRY
jgi:hypothetical protein